MAFIRALLSDLVKLRMPVTAAALVTTVLALVEPFGLSLDDVSTTKVAAALVAVGIIAAYVQTLLGGVKVKTNPATELYPLVPEGRSITDFGGDFRSGGITPGDPGQPEQPRAPGDGDDPTASRTRLP